MIMKNPYRFTEEIPVGEFIPVAGGTLPATEWCRREADRLLRSGIAALAVTRKRCGGPVCYVVRSLEGCKFKPEDKDLVGKECEPCLVV